MSSHVLSLAIIGAGPVGLEAAHTARRLGCDVRVYERASHVGGNVRAWGHVRMFTPWSMLLGPATFEALRVCGWNAPDENACPTGAEFVREYLEPAARAGGLAEWIQTGVEVVAVSRAGVLKHDLTGDPARGEAPFRLLLRASDGQESIAYAHAVIDASGVYGTPNWAGDGGIPAPGERSLGDRIAYALPDVAGADRALYASAHTLLAGAGASAATTACALADLPDARVTWVTRAATSALYALDTPDAPDPLHARAALHARARTLAHGRDPRVAHIGGARIDRFDRTSDGRVRVTLATPSGERHIDVDRVIAHTGFGPDNSLYRELQVHECYASRGPMALAVALLGAGSADCIAIPSFGADILASPEPRFFILGHKSYGTHPEFLLRTGYAQVADIMPRLARSAVGG